MSDWMRCIYCGLLQDEPAGVKECQRCGGELAPDQGPQVGQGVAYLQAQLELDQVQAPAGQTVDRYLLATLRSPAVLPPGTAAPAQAGRPPLHFLAVLDVSGSMQGEKLANARSALRQSLQYLQEGDSLGLVTFSNTAQAVLKPVPFSPDARRQVESVLKEVQAGGMTALDAGLELGIQMSKQNALAGQQSSTRLVLLLSDGQANVGETDLEKVGQRARQARQFGLLVSTLGMGLDYNEALIAEIASQGGGRYYHVEQAQQIPAALTGELGEAASVAARQAHLELALPDGAALISLTPAYPVEQTRMQAVLQVGDIPLDVEMEIPMRLTLLGQPAGQRLSVEGWVRYQSPAGQAVETALNRVTMRFMEAGRFELRMGVAAPVVEKVARYRQEAFVSNFARMRERDPQQAQRQAGAEKHSLYEYVRLINEEKARIMERDLEADEQALVASPAQTKQRVSASYAFIHNMRKKDDHG